VTISAPGLARASTAVRPRAASGIGPAGMRKDSDPATSAPLQAARLTRVRKLLTARVCAVTVRVCGGSGDGCVMARGLALSGDGGLGTRPSPGSMPSVKWTRDLRQLRS
jgi:hypothetical protein